ncbi:hypothetical protein M5X00_09680 [Paenibacillus alvei]|uniref:hypothetical protein n=1 Tax=Paenibacillus alvei TaxID=44250 RepID=UPI000289360F|nr:hypothetical protein [Paenibacillus alvei]EJW18043.1 hypothetical protein PAV_3c04930 [Paenibacillus alvei DSM 29]MCY9542099.1 hypothetical protein [Paenibacillus alvei]MCY9703543.1 hypothetical protein [Paenibacillus alvei]MCY9732424.1 hypothetical protein [Paenibacillus alvei]MCY9754518.1 hypothetical protein [Paenibacillus alvei]
MKNTLTYRMHYRYIRFTGGACRGNLVTLTEIEARESALEKSHPSRLEFTKNTNVKEKKRLPYRETLF